MRADPTKDPKFRLSPQWDEGDLRMQPINHRDKNNPSLGFVASSFSGHERNRLFMQTEDNFDDMSLVSGADFREDGRGFVTFDFDHDGRLDIGVISPHSPRFRLLKNRIGEQQEPPYRSAFVSLVGGQTDAESQTKWSARDAFGATLLVTIGDKKQAYQLSCGEGLASQNSKWVHIGMGPAEKIDRIDISWPSGKKSVRTNITADSRLIVHENESAAESR